MPRLGGRMSGGCEMEPLVTGTPLAPASPPGMVEPPAPTSGAPAPRSSTAALGRVVLPPVETDPDAKVDSSDGDNSGVPLDDEAISEYLERYPWMSRKDLVILGEIFAEWDEEGAGEISCDQMGRILAKVVREIFDQIDSDKNGSLDRREVAEFLRRLGLSLSPEAVNGYFSEMRQGKADGKSVTFEEFNLWWEGFEQGEVSHEELKDLFDEVDEDGSGMIDIDEFIPMICMKMEHKDMKSQDYTGVQMVRMALDVVRADVRAIYGSSAKPQSTKSLLEIDNTEIAKCCFFVPDDDAASHDDASNMHRSRLAKFAVEFRKIWDIMQVILLAYVAIAVPYRMGFTIDIVTGDSWFWFEVF
eukprot:SAG11_NODE_5609_length_1509_cov_1.249645_1_plen_358_part_10